MRANALRFALAEPGDDDAIRALLRETPMHGAVRLTLEREPAYAFGENLAGGSDQTIVVYAGDRLVCMGRCTRREMWVDGSPVRVGYLAELRLAQQAAAQGHILRKGYAFFHQHRPKTDSGLYFSSIGSENARARRVLEQGARWLPRYTFLGELHTLLIAVPRRPKTPRFQMVPVAENAWGEVAAWLNESSRRRQLGPMWSAEALQDLHRRGLQTLRVARDPSGALIACGGLWDQRGFRQTKIQGYGPLLNGARPLLNIWNRMRGLPGLPAPHTVLAHAFISPLGIARGAEALISDAVEALFPAAAAAGLKFLTLSLPEGSPALSGLARRFSVQVWRSRLYRVCWPDEREIDFRKELPFHPESALL